MIKGCATVGDKPWAGEPDKAQWVDEATDLDCLIVRNRIGALCGYVGMPPGHPLHGQSHSNLEALDIDVHGGLTYAGPCQEDGDVCHVPELGRPVDVWWFGFDCAHAWDVVPAFVSSHLPDSTYRDIAYVRAECGSLAAQVARVVMADASMRHPIKPKGTKPHYNRRRHSTR